MEADRVVLVDSSVLIEFMRGKSNVAASIDMYFNSVEVTVLAICPVIEAELLLGARDSHEYNAISKLLQGFEVLHFTEHASMLSAFWVRQFALSHNPSYHDLLIGATAAVHGARLLTLNQKDFSYLPGVELEQVK